MEFFKKLFCRKINIFILLIFFAASFYSFYLYTQTLGVLHAQQSAIKQIPSTNLSNIEIQGYKLGQHFDGEYIYNNGIHAEEETIVRLTYYLGSYVSERENSDILENTITNNGVDIGPELENIKNNLGNDYQIVSDSSLNNDAIVYIDRENNLMLMEKNYYAAAIGSYTIIILQSLDLNKAVVLPDANPILLILAMPLNILLILEGNPQHLSFYIFFPFYCLMFFAPLLNFISSRQKKWLILPIILLTQWGIWWFLANTFGAML